ncbi:MAG: TerB family tellurite resistance protein [Bacteroidia bacterium]
MKQKELAELGYQILMILAIVDGEYEENEIDVILNFIKENYTQEINLEELNDRLSELPQSQQLEYLEKLVKGFNMLSSHDQRVHFLNFAIDLVSADNKIEPEEKRTLSKIASFWNVDYDTSILKRME